jgi:hypothetical protein
MCGKNVVVLHHAIYLANLQIKRVKDADEVPMVCKYAMPCFNSIG